MEEGLRYKRLCPGNFIANMPWYLMIKKELAGCERDGVCYAVDYHNSIMKMGNLHLGEEYKTRKIAPIPSSCLEGLEY